MIRGERGIRGRDELRGTRVERLRGPGPDEGWFGAGQGASRVSNAGHTTKKDRVRKEGVNGGSAYSVGNISGKSLVGEGGG